MNMSSSRRNGLLVALLGGALCVALIPGFAVAASPDEADKIALEGQADPNAIPADSSTLEEEQFFAAQMESEEVSPGAFIQDGTLVNRVYADATASPDKKAIPSHFTKSALDLILSQLTKVGENLPDGHFLGFHYNAEWDAVEAAGNINQNVLPRDLLASGDVIFTYEKDGGRDSRAADTSPYWGGVCIAGGNVCF